MKKKKKLTIRVTPQTAYNLDRLAQLGGQKSPGRVVDKLVRDKMIASETKMNQIKDAEHQWRLLVRKEIRELNANPYILNLKNGLYNVLEDTLTEHTAEYYLNP